MRRIVAEWCLTCQYPFNLSVPSGDTQSVNPPLIKAIARAHAWNQMLMKNEVASIKELASQEGISTRFVCRLLPLAKLAPNIVETIRDGHQHPGMTVNALCD